MILEYENLRMDGTYQSALKWKKYTYIKVAQDVKYQASGNPFIF